VSGLWAEGVEFEGVLELMMDRFPEQTCPIPISLIDKTDITMSGINPPSYPTSTPYNVSTRHTPTDYLLNLNLHPRRTT